MYKRILAAALLAPASEISIVSPAITGNCAANPTDTANPAASSAAPNIAVGGTD